MRFESLALERYGAFTDRVLTLRPDARLHVVLGANEAGKTSALNADCQAHECKNLFLTDGAPFVGQADKNPTWTILALAWRTSEGIARKMKEGSL